jgi:HK97 family phage major capsid protein
MSTQTLADGGFYLQDVIVDEIIPALREQSVFGKLKARYMELKNNVMTMRSEGSGAIAYWLNEGEELTQTNLVGSLSQTNASGIGSYIVVPNQLLDYEFNNVVNDIQKDLINAISYKMDATLLLNTATGGAPLGILGLVDSSQKFNANATVSAVNIMKDLDKAIGLIEDENVPMDNPSMIISNRTRRYLQTLQDTNGFYVFREEMLTKGTINGIPFIATNVIPSNLGSGTNESKVLIGDFQHAVIGNSMNFNFEIIRDAAYKTVAGMQSTTTRNETMFKVFQEMAFNIRYRKAFSAIEVEKWGA